MCGGRKPERISQHQMGADAFRLRSTHPTAATLIDHIDQAAQAGREVTLEDLLETGIVKR